jgi:hypothetical protein
MPFKTYRPTKTDQARAVAAQLKAAGQPVRPKTVLAILAQRGVIMDPGQCSVVTGEFRRRSKRSYTRKAPKLSIRALVAPETAKQPQPLDTLFAAAQFAKRCGGA